MHENIQEITHFPKIFLRIYESLRILYWSFPNNDYNQNMKPLRNLEYSQVNFQSNGFYLFKMNYKGIIQSQYWYRSPKTGR